MEEQTQLKRPGSCPFTPGRLEELYWTEKKSQREIGIIAANINQRTKPYTSTGVAYWMKIYNIPVAKPKAKERRYGCMKKAHSSSMQSDNHKNASRSNIQKAAVVLQAKLQNPTFAKQFHTARSKAMKQKFGGKEIQCEQCGKSKWYPKSVLNTKSYGRFCSQSCSSKHYQASVKKEKEFQSLVEMSLTGVPIGKVVRVCEFCQQEFLRNIKTDRSAGTRKARCFCSAKCRGQSAWGHQPPVKGES